MSENEAKNMKMSLSKFLKFWFPVLIYSVIIFCISSIPKIGFEIKLPFIDKVAHIVEYGILGFLFVRALNATSSLSSRGLLIFWAAMFCFLYGLSDEYHQLFIPGRIAALSDVFADGMGGIIGGLIYKL